MLTKYSNRYEAASCWKDWTEHSCRLHLLLLSTCHSIQFQLHSISNMNISKRLKKYGTGLQREKFKYHKVPTINGYTQNLVRKSLLLNRRTEVASQNDHKTWIHCLLKYQPSSFIKWMNMAIQLYNCCWTMYFSLNLSVHNPFRGVVLSTSAKPLFNVCRSKMERNKQRYCLGLYPFSLNTRSGTTEIVTRLNYSNTLWPPFFSIESQKAARDGQQSISRKTKHWLAWSQGFQLGHSCKLIVPKTAKVFMG